MTDASTINFELDNMPNMSCGRTDLFKSLDSEHSISEGAGDYDSKTRRMLVEGNATVKPRYITNQVDC